jgi:hypothetical protein
MRLAEWPAVVTYQPQVRPLSHRQNVVDLGCRLIAAGLAATRVIMEIGSAELLPFTVIASLPG